MASGACLDVFDGDFWDTANGVEIAIRRSVSALLWAICGQRDVRLCSHVLRCQG